MANYELKSENADVEVFKVIPNLFPQEFLETIHQFNSEQNWKWNGDSLYTDLTGIDFFEKTCVEHINRMTGIEHELYRCYRSGTLPTTTTAKHYDTHTKGDRTIVFYGHMRWEDAWGGETIFGENDSIYVKPIPNSAVYFSCKHYPHVVRPPNHMSSELRITYMWKLKSKENKNV
jgi:hypothetical protein